MQTLHLFAGGGGGLLADLILGHQPIAAVEFDAKCCASLRERAADGWFPGLHVHEIDVRLFDPSEYAGRVDCIHAGFPCQPHSLVGLRTGEADERNLWPDTARVVGEVRPRYVFLENVAGIFAAGYLWTVIGDLSALGYDARWLPLLAADVGAPHDRERWWCLAERADAVGERLQGQPQAGPASRPADRSGDGVYTGWWQIEPGVGRVADGVADRIHRIKTIGNGQVPLAAAFAWRILGGP